nr:LysR substrate-binding domain-containing protein [Massilia sp. JS1662]
MRQLRLLVALDTHRNLRLAAQAMCVTQPGASTLLKTIETTLGVPLFERMPRPMAPTQYGETVIRHARMTIASLGRGLASLESLRAGATGKVLVGSIMTPALTLLPRAIADVKARAPRLHVGVHTDSSERLFEMLERGAVDFMVGRLPKQVAVAAWCYEPLADEHACVVVRVGHPLLDRRGLKLAHLAALAWILPKRGNVLRERFDAVFAATGVPAPRNVVEADAPLVVTSLLQHTDALNVMPLEVARHSEAMGLLRILPLALPCTLAQFGLAYAANRPLSPAAALMLNAARAAAGRTTALKP